VCLAKPDLAPDRPVARRTVLVDPPNWYSECQFGASPEWPGGPPNRPAYGPVLPDLPPNWPAYINSWGGLQISFSPTPPPPHARPHLHGRRLLKLLLPLASPPNQSLPNFDRV
jgi:hypothetical protein